MRYVMLVSLATLWPVVCLANTIHVPSEQPTIKQLNMLLGFRAQTERK